MIGGVLGMGRSMAESRMTETCTVSRLTEGDFDDSTGEHAVTAEVIYTGKCRVKAPTTTAKPVEAGSQLLVMSALEVHLPLAAVGVDAEDVIEITGSTVRADQVGRAFKVVAPFDGSQTTALRFRVEVADAR